MRTEIIEYYEVEFEVEYTFIEGDFSTGLTDAFIIQAIYINGVEVYEILSDKVIDYLHNEIAQRC
jgi:dTDP-glucose pyrophosphorylase